MRRIIALSTLIGLAIAVGAPSSTKAQTQGQAQGQIQGQSPAVPGPYQGAPQQAANPYANSANSQPLPYWMRAQQGGAIPGDTTVARNFISGWTWTQNTPVRGYGVNTQPQGARPYGAGYWPAPPQTGFSTPIWTPPGYAPGRWPKPPYGAPQYYGAPLQPNQ